MSDLLTKLDEMEARHAAEIAEIRGAIKKEDALIKELILGGMFTLESSGDVTYLVDIYGHKILLAKYQVEQLRAIHKIAYAAYMTFPEELMCMFKEAEELGLKFR